MDQYYQIRKIKDLLGMECEKFTDGSNTNYSALARDLLKSGSVSSITYLKSIYIILKIFIGLIDVTLGPLSYAQTLPLKILKKVSKKAL